MPFCDVVAIYDYWADHPPLHVMVASYLGVESSKRITNPMEAAAAMQALAGKGKAAKVATAPEMDRARFEALKGEFKKKNAR